MFSVLCLLCLCTHLFICALWSPAGKGLTSWFLFVLSNCKLVTFRLVSWVRCGTWLYRVLIFAPLLTFIETFHNRCTFSMKLAWFAVTIQWVIASRNSQDLVFHHILVIQTLLLNIVNSKTLKRTNEFFLLDWCNKLGMVHWVKGYNSQIKLKFYYLKIFSVLANSVEPDKMSAVVNVI